MGTEVLYSSQKGHTANIVAAESRTFEFEIKQGREDAIPTSACYGAAIFGTMSIVGRQAFPLQDSFDLEIFVDSRHRATVRDVTPTCTLREYNLADRHICEIKFIARAIDEPKGAHCGN